MQMWFVLKGETVVGPIGSDKVLASYSGQNVMVWGVPCAEWLSFSEWSQQLDSGVFNVVEARIPIKPKTKKSDDESMVFKVRPQAGVMNIPVEQPKVEEPQVEEQNDEDNFVQPEKTKFQDLSALSNSKTSSAPLPNIPSVDDIFPSDIPSQEDHDKEVSDVLNDQLNNFLQESSFNDGNTLIQATMDELNHELEAEALSSPAAHESDLGDGATQVQAVAPVEDISLDTDGATTVQAIGEQETPVEDLSLESDGATMVQAAPPVDEFSLESDGATQVQSTPPTDEFSLDYDGATQVQSAPPKDELSLEYDGATQVQAAPKDEFSLDFDSATQVQSTPPKDELSLDYDGATQVQSVVVDEFNLDDGAKKVQANPPVDELSLESDGATQVQNVSMDDLSLDGATQVQSVDESSLGEFTMDGATQVQAPSEDSMGEFSLESLEQSFETASSDELTLEAASEVQNETQDMGEFFNADAGQAPDNVIPLHPVAQAPIPEVSVVEGAIDFEKTNVAELKEVAQQIEQNKSAETPVWYVAYEGQSEGPINVEALLKKLDGFENPEFIYLWKKGFPDWQNLFDTPQISSQLGIGFRRHERFSFSGTVKIEFNGNIQIGQLENISVSGIGATGFGPLVLGETVKVTLDCTDLDSEIEFIAKIRFTSELGVLGLSFVKDQYAENINKILDLVKAVSAQNAA